MASMPISIGRAQMGVSLFAGEAEGRLDEVLRDAAAGTLKPLYNYMDDLPGIEGTPIPLMAAQRVQRTAGGVTSFDAGRGCPYQCSFCTIINVQGRKSRRRSPDRTSKRSCASTTRRACAASSSPTIISPATRTGSRSSTG